MSRCCSCDAPIRWAKTAAGKTIPIDAEPRRDGNVQLGYVGGYMVAIVVNDADALAAQAAGHDLYVSHFATCPNAGAHRRSSSPSNGPGKPAKETERSAAPC
jgi:hypothetical protein